MSAEPSLNPSGSASSGSASSSTSASSPQSPIKDPFLAEIRKSKFVFYNTVVAQAQKIEVTADRVTFSFSSSQRALKDNCDQNRAWLESIAEKIAGKKIAVSALQIEAPAPAGEAAPADDPSARKNALRERAMADAGVRALLEMFPAEIRDVEEM
jgi:hypothetical protein